MKSPRDKATEIDWARLAAFIDGEGCISIFKYNETKHDIKRRQMYLRIFVVNTDPRLVIWCQNTFGGSASEVRNRKHKACYRWTVTCKAAEEVIQGCLPFFILKREQAEVALAFRKTTFKRDNWKRNQIAVSDEVQNLRLHCFEELKRLKRETRDFEEDGGRWKNSHGSVSEAPLVQ